jgi:hypothetical protein
MRTYNNNYFNIFDVENPRELTVIKGGDSLLKC